MYYVGIDWADQKHDLTIVAGTGTILVQNLTIAKNPEGFEHLLDKLRQLSDDLQQFKIGIETPNNLLVDFLVDWGYPVFALFPGAMKSLRKRYRTSGARDDQFDSFVIADTLRTDVGHALSNTPSVWRAVDFGSDLVREIRLLARDHHDLVAEHVRLNNSLRSTLKEYYPEYLQFFSDVACASSLAFLKAYPDFHAAHALTREQIADFFKEQQSYRQKTVNRIFERLQRPPLKVPAVLIHTKRRKALVCVNRLFALVSELEQYHQQLQERVEQHPDGRIFLSYPGVSYVTAARLLAFFGDNRKRYNDVSELQGRSGTVPVTEKSGKSLRVIYFRRACNKFYRDVMHRLAFSSLRTASWAWAFYQKHRAQGKTHNHALRCLANLHVRILFAMWKNQTCYDENLFLAQRARHLIANQK
jgi:transposase